MSLSSCATGASSDGEAFLVTGTAGTELTAQSMGAFDRPWAMTFLPDGQLLVTEKGGKLWLVTPETGERRDVQGLPEIRAAGQGGLGDIVLHPDFANNRRVYVSYVERDGDKSGAAVASATLTGFDDDGAAPELTDFRVIWRQTPKVTGSGHYGHRLAFSPDGFLFITSGDRQKFTPAQDMTQNLGKVVRLYDDGSLPPDNPFADQEGVAREVWSLGHRNPLGIAFDDKGQLWVHEMGPRGGDELNRVERGSNYGYPLVSNGIHYNGDDIPDHDTRPDLAAPAISWTPVISPSGLVIYDGNRYESFHGSALIGGLSSQALVQVSLGDDVAELERFPMNKRIREVELGPADTLYVLEDKSGGRLLRLLPGDQLERLTSAPD